MSAHTLLRRFDFNIYSYESEWTMGAEWWIRKANKGKEKENGSQLSDHSGLRSGPIAPPMQAPPRPADEVLGVVKARMSTKTVRHHFLHLASCILY